jgi:hypothetical protein
MEVDATNFTSTSNCGKSMATLDISPNKFSIAITPYNTLHKTHRWIAIVERTHRVSPGLLRLDVGLDASSCLADILLRPVCCGPRDGGSGWGQCFALIAIGVCWRPIWDGGAVEVRAPRAPRPPRVAPVASSQYTVHHDLLIEAG